MEGKKGKGKEGIEERQSDGMEEERERKRKGGEGKENIRKITY